MKESNEGLRNSMQATPKQEKPKMEEKKAQKDEKAYKKEPQREKL